MRNNLIKILALSAITLGLGACGGKTSSSSSSSEESVTPVEEAQLVNFVELYDFNETDGIWALEGKLVTVEGLGVQGKYGNTIIGGGSTSQYIDSLFGVEIQAKEAPVFTQGSGWGAKINATGRVTDVNGRLTLADADVEIVSERVSGDSTSGISISYCPAKYMDRSFFSGSLNRKHSGGYYQANVQIASLPQRATVDAETSFSVVFPGENTDAEDLENNSLITVTVPAGLSETSVTRFNDYFFTEGSEVAVQDYVCLDLLAHYDKTKGGLGFIYTSFGDFLEANPDELPAIKNSWSEVSAYYQPYFTNAIPNLDTELPFSYVLDDTYLTKDFKDNWADAYKDKIVQVYNSADCATLKVTLNFKESEFEAVGDKFFELILGTEEAPTTWEYDSSLASSGLYIFTNSAEVEGESKIVEQVVLIPVTDASMELYYTGLKAASSTGTGE